MNRHVYWYDGRVPTFHGTLGEIKPGHNQWVHLDHDVVMSYGLVNVCPDAVDPHDHVVEPTPSSVDSRTPMRRRSGRHLEAETAQGDPLEG